MVGAAGLRRPLPARKQAGGRKRGKRFPGYNREIFPEDTGRGKQTMNDLHMIDISNPAGLQLVAEFPYPQVPEGFPYPNLDTAGLDGAQGPYGPHNIHEPMSGKPWPDQNPNRVCRCLYAGMRVYDVPDPYYINKLACFTPPTPEKLLNDIPVPGPVEDCAADGRGYIYMYGIYILRVKDGGGSFAPQYRPPDEAE